MLASYGVQGPGYTAPQSIATFRSGNREMDSSRTQRLLLCGGMCVAVTWMINFDFACIRRWFYPQ